MAQLAVRLPEVVGSNPCWWATFLAKNIPVPSGRLVINITWNWSQFLKQCFSTKYMPLTVASFLVGAFLKQSARLLMTVASFFVRPCTYHFLVQTLIGLVATQQSRVRVPASVSNFFVLLQNRTRQKGFETSNFLSPNGPPSIFFDIW